MTTKVLFLDIDGVLTSARAHVALSPKDCEGLIWHHFDPVAIGFLNRLQELHPDLLTVLSSSWRNIWNQQTMTMFLSSQGWAGKWHSNWKTPHIGYPRGQEIEAWCKEHKPDRFVILDDVADMTDEQQPHFVQTDAQDGLNSLDHWHKMKEAIKRKSPYGSTR